MKKLLFVCLGNICRSPVAEQIMRSLIEKASFENIECDSCGTSTYHLGHPPDIRMTERALKRGYDLAHLKARRFKDKDFLEFHYIFTMDLNNYKTILKKDTKGLFRTKIFKMTDFCKLHDIKEVPDPYLGGEGDFELVLDILEDACSEILLKLKTKAL